MITHSKKTLYFLKCYHSDVIYFFDSISHEGRGVKMMVSFKKKKKVYLHVKYHIPLAAVHLEVWYIYICPDWQIFGVDSLSRQVTHGSCHRTLHVCGCCPTHKLSTRQVSPAPGRVHGTWARGRRGRVGQHPHTRLAHMTATCPGLSDTHARATLTLAPHTCF